MDNHSILRISLLYLERTRCNYSFVRWWLHMGEIYYINSWVRDMNAISTISVHDVAKAFLNKEEMTHKKLQKLCYYAYSWYYTLYGRKLFNNNFQAWIHGPVDPSLYHSYKEYGWRDIPSEHSIPTSISEDKHVSAFIDEVYGSYGHLDGDELEYLTHSEEPWKSARGDIPEFIASSNAIDDSVIISFYRRVLEDGQQD
jgi:uncharacterized phage-associated protein